MMRSDGYVERTPRRSTAARTPTSPTGTAAVVARSAERQRPYAYSSAAGTTPSVYARNHTSASNTKNRVPTASPIATPPTSRPTRPKPTAPGRPRLPTYARYAVTGTATTKRYASCQLSRGIVPTSASIAVKAAATATSPPPSAVSARRVTAGSLALYRQNARNGTTSVAKYVNSHSGLAFARSKASTETYTSSTPSATSPNTLAPNERYSKRIPRIRLTSPNPPPVALSVAISTPPGSVPR